MQNTCSLCSIELSRFPIVDGEKSFCCSGCHAVYQILASKQLLDNYQESLVFKQALKTGLISNPALLEQIRKQKSHIENQELEKFHLEIQDMWCPSCAEVICLVLLQQKGIANCIIDYTTDLASIEFSARYISKEKILEIISSFGYAPLTLENSQHKKISLSLYIRFGLAAFCALNAMMFAYPLYATYFDFTAHDEGKIFAWLTFFSSLPAITYCMWPIWKRFISAMQLGLLGMEALVVVGVFSAFGLSLYELMQGSNQVYFDSMTVIIAFVLLGKIIETKAKFSAKDSLFRLSQSLPRKGRKCFLDGSTAFVPIKEIIAGDTMIAYTGEKIILDGEVIKGEGTCDESLMTGESLPVSKQPGSKLLGGSILQQGILTFKVLSPIEESTLQRIIHTVEQNLGYKSTYERAADRIVRWFVPLVFFVAFITGAVGLFFKEESALLRTLSVLLIACPCAIGIAAPLAESQILHRLAELGVIIRNRGCLSLLPRISTFIFDKTGTVTEGHFRVLSGLEKLSEQEKIVLKSLAQQSNHLISRAIFNAIDSECIELDYVEECPGKGLQGLVYSKKIFLGSGQFLKEQEVQIENEEETDRKNEIVSTVYFSSDGLKATRLFLGDRVRREIPEVLKKLNVKSILLSGDSQQTVKAVADYCGFDQHFSGANPLKKRILLKLIVKMRLCV